MEDLPNSSGVGEAFQQTDAYRENSVDFWWMFLGNFGLKNERTFSVWRLWLLLFLSPNKTKIYNFFFLFFFFCMREDEFNIEQETSEKKKHSLESNENSPEVSGLTRVNSLR